ncbi:MAG: gliding motility protein GldM [Crocinitomicaceae bacterium]
MAGGKETPRQKMIGMMYLVLTALLALNVSKSILDAFVAIEENIQKANRTEIFRGDDKRSELVEISSDKTNKIRAAKAAKYLDVVAEIDALTAKRIKLIDDIKLEILKECGEDVTSKGDLSIIMKPYDARKAPCTPIRMNLDKVEGKDKYDDPMRIMLGNNTDIKKPTGKGMELWKSMLGYRKEITEIIASSRVVSDENGNLSFDSNYKFNAPNINAFKSPQDLNNKILKAVESSNVHIDDKDVLMEIYRSLSKEEYSTVHDVENVHWLGKTFDHSPSVAAIASLSSLQRDILSARAAAIAHVRSRVGGGDFTFNSIIPVAYGPEVVNEGEEFTISVLMAAFDSDKQPRVMLDGDLISDIRDGKGNITLKGAGQKMELKGKIAVQNKQGVWKEREWSKTITVMKPSGSIELPGFNILYRGYDNVVNATASGYPTTSLNGSNVSISKSGAGYIVRPNNAGTATLSVSGTTADGKTVSLKRMEFKVRRLPSPQLYWGGEKDGGRIPSSTLLRAMYGPEIPLNANFTVRSWTANAIGMKSREFSGPGSNLSGLNQLKQLVPSGTDIIIRAKIVRPDGITEEIKGTWTKP